MKSDGQATGNPIILVPIRAEIPAEEKERLRRLAMADGRSMAFVAGFAISRCLQDLPFEADWLSHLKLLTD